jgi:hypothetical protein
MGGISTLDGLYIALAFVVPGFVFSAVRNQFATGRERQGSEQIFRFITYSAFNYAIFSGVIYLVLYNYQSPLVRAGLWFFVILIGPAALGIASGASIQNDWARKLFHRMRLHPVHLVPSAWDYKFGRMEGQWVLVTLKNDVKFAGFCGVTSFASSDTSERDLYIEHVFDIDDDNKWTPTQKSLLICSGEIRTIEFWPVTKEIGNVEQRPAASATDACDG